MHLIRLYDVCSCGWVRRTAMVGGCASVRTAMIAVGTLTGGDRYRGAEWPMGMGVRRPSAPAEQADLCATRHSGPADSHAGSRARRFTAGTSPGALNCCWCRQQRSTGCATARRRTVMAHSTLAQRIRLATNEMPAAPQVLNGTQETPFSASAPIELVLSTHDRLRLSGNTAAYTVVKQQSLILGC